MTARIDSIDPLGELIIIFNVSVDIPVMVPLDQIFNNSIINIYVQQSEIDDSDDLDCTTDNQQ